MTDNRSSGDVTRMSALGSDMGALDSLPRTALQALYHEITGKTESITKFYNKYFVISVDDLNQLNYKIKQQLEHYDIIGPTLSVEVQHENLETQKFSSWDKFQEYDASRTEVIGEVSLKYEFLVSLPTVGKHTRYVLTIGVRSLLAEGRDLNRLSRLLLQGLPTIRCEIEYVDYLVAKNFLNAIDSWVNSLEDVETKHHYPKLQQHASRFLFFAIRLGYLATVIFAFLTSDLFFDSILGASPGNLLNWLFLVGVVLVLTSIVMYIFAELLESFIMRTRSLSCIKINRGDKKRYADQQKENKNLRNKAFVMVGGFIFAVSANIFSVFVINWIMN